MGGIGQTIRDGGQILHESSRSCRCSPAAGGGGEEASWVVPSSQGQEVRLLQSHEGSRCTCQLHLYVEQYCCTLFCVIVWLCNYFMRVDHSRDLASLHFFK